MTDPSIMPDEVRARLARRTTPAERRSAWFTFALLALTWISMVHRDLMRYFEFSRISALLAAAVPMCLVAVFKVRQLRVRGPEDYSQAEVDEAIGSSIACSKCGTRVLISEWSCPSCGSTRHQFWARPEFLPALFVLVLALLIFGQLVR